MIKTCSSNCLFVSTNQYCCNLNKIHQSSEDL